eukprot:PhF_6_TR42876/c0_g1_i1/m.64958
MISLLPYSAPHPSVMLLPIQKLPRDCLNDIVSFCSKCEQSNINLVCRAWYHAVDRELCLAEKLYYVPDSLHRTLRASGKTNHHWWEGSSHEDAGLMSPMLPYVVTAYLRCSAGIPVLFDTKYNLTSLQTLELKDVSGTDLVGMLRHVASTSIPLQKLVVLKSNHLDDVDVSSSLNSISTLQEVHIIESKLLSLSHICESRTLRKFVLQNTRGTSMSLKGLGAVRSLEEVIVSDADGIDATSVLGESCSLRHLEVSYCDLQDADGCQDLHKVRTLAYLNLSYTKITSVSYLRPSFSLRILDVHNCYKLVNIDGIECIRTLEELNLSQTKITSVGALGLCQSLRKLNLRGCRHLVEVQGLELIPAFEELNVSDTRIACLRCLSASSSLRVLDAHDCRQLGDIGVQGMERIPTLQELILTDTRIT